MFNPLILLAIVSFVSSHDVIVGTNTEGRKIYDENRHASPTIWRQTENVTITTTDAEVISRIVIKDRRPDKDGDVKIVDGGVGQKNVTLELKSPTVLRGYDFQIEVYSIPEDKFKSSDNVVPNLDQTRVQRNPEEDRNKPSSPSVVANDPKQDSASKNDPTSTDTRVNQNTDDDTNEQKPNSGPVPFVGNRPQTYNVPATEPVRHAREALNPELPEENQSNQKKPNENKDEGGNIKTFTPRPSLISRQSSLGKPEGIPQSVSTNKPDEGQRNARDAQDKDSKIDNANTTPKADLPNSRAFPSYPKIAPGSAPIVNAKDESKRDARDTDSNTKNEDQKTKLNTNVNYRIGDKSFSASTTKKPDDGKREVRDTEHEKSNEEGNISTQRPALIPRLSTFNKPTSQSVSTTKPDNLNEGQRSARDTEHDKNSDNDNTTPKANIGISWTHPSAPRSSFDTTPQLGVKSFSTSTKPDNEGKRDARDTDHENNSTAEAGENNKKPHPQHLILIPRQKSLNTPTLQSVTTTSKPDSPNEQKRNARDVEDENTTPKVLTTKTHPLNPKISSFDSKTLSTSTKKPENAHEDKRNARDTEHNNDGTSKPDGQIISYPKTLATQSAPTQDKTTENKNEDNATSRPLFIPPPGYQRVVTANHDEKDRFARDADNNEKQDNTKDQSSSTVQPLSKNDGLKRVPPSLYASRVQYQPLPYSTQVTTSTVSPTTKSQNKRDTEPKISQTEEDKLKTVPRMFGEQGQNSTTSKPNPVISIQ